MGRLLLAAALVGALWYVYVDNNGRGLKISGGTPFGGVSAAPGAVVKGATAAATGIAN